MPAVTRYAYLHGFGSGPDSKKGRLLAAAFQAAGKHLDRLDLNAPSFGELTISAARDAVGAWAGDDRVALVGSSLGGYIAALHAVHNPNVTALVLLCPGVDMVQRWPALLGDKAMARWRDDGVLPLPDARGKPTPIHWRFIEDAIAHDPLPRPSCPTLVIHGSRDRTVTIDSSRTWVASLPNARLIEVDDGHELYASMDLIERETLAFFV